MKRIVIAQCNGCRIIKPSAFVLIHHEPRFHYAVLSDMRKGRN